MWPPFPQGAHTKRGTPADFDRFRVLVESGSLPARWPCRSLVIDEDPGMTYAIKRLTVILDSSRDR